MASALERTPACRWLRQRPYVDDQCIFVTGHSLGAVSRPSGSARATIGSGSARRILPDLDQPQPRPRCPSPMSFVGSRRSEGIRRSIGPAHPGGATNVGRSDRKTSADIFDVPAACGNRTVKAYFARDEQGARRTRAAYASSPGSFVHYLHFDVPLSRRCGTCEERGAQRFVQEPGRAWSRRQVGPGASIGEPMLRD